MLPYFIKLLLLFILPMVGVFFMGEIYLEPFFRDCVPQPTSESSIRKGQFSGLVIGFMLSLLIYLFL